MLVKKDALKPGMYPKGQDELIVIQADDIRELNASVPAVQAAGYKIPLWLNHPLPNDPRQHPVRADDRAAIASVTRSPWFAGWQTASEIGADDTLTPEFEVSDEMGQRLQAEGTFLSPMFGELRDQNGKVLLKKAIHHYALTEKPVNPRQSKKFAPSQGGVYSSPGAEGQTAAAATRMSLDDALQGDEKYLRFSLGDAMPLDSGMSRKPGEVTGLEEHPADGELKSRLTEALKSLGITLDAGSPILQDSDAMKQVLSVLVQALTDSTNKVKGAATGNDSSSLTETPTVIAMSTETTETTPEAVDITKHPAFLAQSAELTRMSQENTAFKGQVNALLGVVTNERREKLRGRIEALFASGRCDATTKEALLTQATTYQFSADSPDAKSELEVHLSIHEKLPQGAFLSTDERVARMGLDEHPNAGNGIFRNGDEPTPERTNELMQELYPENPLQKVVSGAFSFAK